MIVLLTWLRFYERTVDRETSSQALSCLLMDAIEADADVKLYKASDKLLQELRAKLPLLVRPSNAAQSRVRRRVLWGKDDDLIKLVSWDR